MIDQVTSLRERGVTEWILSGYPGVSKELLVTVWCFGGSYKPNYSTEILRKVVRMCEQCVPGRIFRRLIQRDRARSIFTQAPP